MKFLDEIRKCVGFVGYRNKLTDAFIPAGTFFYLSNDDANETGISINVFAVTARHVIDGLARKGVDEVVLRLNKGGIQAGTMSDVVPIGYWFFHPSDKAADVAVAKLNIPVGADHLVIPRSFCLTPEIISENEVSLGDEVFVSGLFRHHFGGPSRNIPIVRVGNIATLREELVQTSLGPMDAYLIEARSIGGISGSPAFVHLGQVRQIGNQIQFMTGKPLLYLMGLVHGHFDVKQSQVDEASVDGLTEDSINSGIAIIVPIEKVFEVFDSVARAELALISAR